MSTDKKMKINELTDLPYYRNEYTAQLEAMGITTVAELKKALADKEKAQAIEDELEGIGPKYLTLWKKELGVKSSRKKAAEEEPETEIVEADTEVVEEGGYRVKKKPELDEETKKLLALRNEMSNDRIAFLRQEWFRYSRLGEKWRKPRGLHSKMRRHYSYRPNIVSVGYRGPAKVRGLHSSGFQEVMVYNPEQLDKVDPKTQAVRVGSSVGFKKRQAIEAKADDMGIRVLNRTG